MKGSERFCILMTATVAPKGTAGTATYRSDPQVRLADYREGLRFWLQLKDDRIGGVVFVENSGYPLEALRAEADSGREGSRRCEFISCDFPPPPEGLHYGYSEFTLWITR